MKKKGEALPLNTIIIAVLVLIVLIVLIIIFREQISGIVKSFTGISKDAQYKADESKGGLSDIFGKCEEGKRKCGISSIMICKNGIWEEEKRCNADEVCEGNVCTKKK